MWLNEGIAAISSFSGDVVAANTASNDEGLDDPRVLLKDLIGKKGSVDVANELCSLVEELRVYLADIN